MRRHTPMFVAGLVGAMVAVPIVVYASHSFSDVSDSNTFHEDIAWLAQAGVTKGCNPPANTEFCPEDEVTREQMAAFLHRLADNQVVDAGRVGGKELAEVIAVRSGHSSYGYPEIPLNAVGLLESCKTPPITVDEDTLVVATGDLSASGFHTGGYEARVMFMAFNGPDYDGSSDRYISASRSVLDLDGWNTAALSSSFVVPKGTWTLATAVDVPNQARGEYSLHECNIVATVYIGMGADINYEYLYQDKRD